VLVILASRGDETARELAARCAELEPALLTAGDLSSAGWELRIPGGAGAAVISGKRVPSSEIRGVLTRLPAVTEMELDHVVPGDRSYVAREMTAFLAAWLSSLECPVLNRPSPNCLLGPNWRPEQWLLLAARIGIPVVDWTRDTGPGPDATPARDTTTVTVIEERCVGYAHPTLAAHARQLARAAGVELLAVHFSGPKSSDRLTGVDPAPDLSAVPVSDALIEHFRARMAC
jgi:hypothetical protein